ncbi:hypothetical protein CBOM_04259 [Ceraceosorus bombacis]|uniref:Uncharacterized protein n=1 Tax=Ceraceosorus bombacis TaxID=401625 RepID=A0A0P1BN76_9BASI|nr:hypothetical protein CBOM_04259 [Ceraceosorus bombacis]
MFSNKIALTSAVLAVASIASAAPLDSRAPPAGCSEAARFGTFSVQPASAKIGDELTVTYTQRCADYANIHPTSLSLTLGANQIPFAVIEENKAYPGDGKTLTFTTTVPDTYAPAHVDPSKLNLWGTIKFNQPGPKGKEATHLYNFSQNFALTQ